MASKARTQEDELEEMERVCMDLGSGKISLNVALALLNAQIERVARGLDAKTKMGMNGSKP
jgi:dihydroxyacetone kinase DhaKLM complex PTS-EIIA-like component DhaM